MEEKELFKKQFLLTKEKGFDLLWKECKINDYTLFYHPDLHFAFSKYEDTEIYMLGDMYDWENPVNSNQNITDSLSTAGSLEAFIESHSMYAGQFMMIYKDRDHFIILNDAASQSEVYYDTTFTSFGTQPRIIGRVTLLKTQSSEEAAMFYSSPAFLSRKLFVGSSTHMENIKHLLPNHYIDLNNKLVKRFFPVSPVKPLSINNAAEIAGKMLKGYIQAIAVRSNIALAVTGGYDSRVLFLSSLGVKCKYFVSKHRNMRDDHYDITIPQKITKIHGKEFLVISDSQEGHFIANPEYEQSIDFPRNHAKGGRGFEDCIYINGNISEVARNYYGYFKKLSAGDLAYLSGYKGLTFASMEYQKWLDSSSVLFSEMGYDIQDMFYWEEKMGIWGAKSKTEMNQLGMSIFSPFCSREFLKILLSTPRKDRDSQHNKLYDIIIKKLSPEVSRIPINPCRRQNMIRIMKTLHVYNLYRTLGLKYRKLDV